jgi:hypothetical protein
MAQDIRGILIPNPQSYYICLFATVSASVLTQNTRFSLSVTSRSVPTTMAFHGEDVTLHAAIDATVHLHIRDLPEHVAVGPLPVGTVNPAIFPFKEVDLTVRGGCTHFFDVVWHVEMTPATKFYSHVKHLY